MTSSMLERVVRMIVAIGVMPVATTGRIQPFQLSSPETGSQPRLSENTTMSSRLIQKPGMAAPMSERNVAV